MISSRKSLSAPAMDTSGEHNISIRNPASTPAAFSGDQGQTTRNKTRRISQTMGSALVKHITNKGFGVTIACLIFLTGWFLTTYNFNSDRRRLNGDKIVRVSTVALSGGRKAYKIFGKEKNEHKLIIKTVAKFLKKKKKKLIRRWDVETATKERYWYIYVLDGKDDHWDDKLFEVLEISIIAYGIHMEMSQHDLSNNHNATAIDLLQTGDQTSDSRDNEKFIAWLRKKLTGRGNLMTAITKLEENNVTAEILEKKTKEEATQELKAMGVQSIHIGKLHRLAKEFMKLNLEQ